MANENDTRVVPDNSTNIESEITLLSERLSHYKETIDRIELKTNEDLSDIKDNIDSVSDSLKEFLETTRTQYANVKQTLVDLERDSGKSSVVHELVMDIRQEINDILSEFENCRGRNEVIGSKVEDDIEKLQTLLDGHTEWKAYVDDNIKVVSFVRDHYKIILGILTFISLSIGTYNAIRSVYKPKKSTVTRKVVEQVEFKGPIVTTNVVEKR